MRKVLIVIRELSYGGAEKSLISFLKTLDEEYLEKNNIKIDLLLTNRGGFFNSHIPKYINVIDCPTDFETYCNPIKNVIENKNLNIKSLFRKIQSVVVKKMLLKKSGLSAGELQWKYVGKYLKRLEQHYDVAIAYFHDASAYYVIDKVDANRKIIWIHNEYEKLGFTDVFEREFYEKADRVITISDRCVNSFLRHFPDMEYKVTMIENITSKLIVTQMSKQFNPKEYIDDNTVKILSIGRLSHQKGYDLGIEAMKILKETYDNFHWYIIGAGELEEELKLHVENADLSNHITFLGLRENPYPYIAGCDIFFQPSRFEGKSIALDEAIILCKPIVVTNYDTVYDSITNGENGIICNMVSEDIAGGLLHLVENEKLREKLKIHLSMGNQGNEEEISKYLELLT